MKQLVGSLVFAAAVLSSPAARAQTVPPAPSPLPSASADAFPAPAATAAPQAPPSVVHPAGGDIVPGSLSGAGRPTSPPLPAPPLLPAGSPAPSAPRAVRRPCPQQVRALRAFIWIGPAPTSRAMS